MMTEEEPIQIVIFMTHGAGVLVPGCGHMNHIVKMPNRHCDYHMCLSILTVFPGERCGPWASCFVYFYHHSFAQACCLG